jgi:phosphohistidine phosphatase
VDLYLVRHAIAEDRDPERWPDDADRPLTPEGEQLFQQAARGLARIVPSVDAVLASPFVRAWRTAELLAEEADWPPPEECRPLEAGRPAAGLVAVLRDLGNDRSLALVGHEPDLSDLASRLMAGKEGAIAIEMKKGGVASLLVDDDLSSATLRWLATPKILRGLDRSKA